MDVTVRDSIADGEHDLVFTRPWHNPWVLSSMSEHDLRDLEFVLARRRAMAKACPGKNGEHTCALTPGHGTGHECRGCDARWSGTG